MRRLGLLCAPVGLVALALLAGGCGPDPIIRPFANQIPILTLTAGPISETGRYFYSVPFNWTAYDPDGRVDYYLYAVDPPEDPGRDTTWVRTERNEQTILFSAADSSDSVRFSDEHHVFALKAVDNRGAASPVLYRAFYAKTEAPTVDIDDPPPSDQSIAFVTPSVLIRWHGDDFDGVFTKKPVKYKYKMLTDATEISATAARANPVSVRRYYAARAWAGWDSTGADTTFAQFRNLVPDKSYCFCVIAIDEAGAFSPIFSLRQNMLFMRVTFAGNNNPTITMFNELFFYTYPGGGYEPANPERVIRLEVPAGQEIRFNWFATAIPGSAMKGYRWVLDPPNQDLNDNTQRSDEQTDWHHWSQQSIETVTATIGPFQPDGVTHLFYVEAEDINNLKSLGTIGFTVVAPMWDDPVVGRPLLVVKDWRLLVDSKFSATQTCVDPPKLQWPTSAELDTFLFARGGFPWKCYPMGTNSTPGLFAGYDFDTVGTRIGRKDQTVALSRLARYRNVVWITDIAGAANPGDGSSTQPYSALRYMTGPNKANTLATYARQGGRVWLLGGGAVDASLVEWNRTGNDFDQPAPGRTYQSQEFAPTLSELVPGRFVFDFAKWQSEIKPTKVPANIYRLLGRNAADPIYNALPANLQYHSEADGDVFPPGRTPRIDQLFYYTESNIEYLSRPNDYQEDLDPTAGEDLRSALDTLYAASSGTMVNPSDGTNFFNVIMTVYPARSLNRSERATFVLSGHDIWSYRRYQCQALVDFVVGTLWGVPPRTGSSVAFRRGMPPPQSVTARPGGQAPETQVPQSIGRVRQWLQKQAPARKSR